MRRYAALLALGLLLMAAPAQAITFGDEDDGDHPNVGALMLALDIDENGTKTPIVFVMCTGTLLKDNVFLTAAHCVSDPFPGGSLVGVSFADDVTDIKRSQLIPVVETKVHPSWQGRFGASAKNVDIAVALLGSSPEDVKPAILPDVGLVDRLDYATQRFTTVGYGVARDDKTKGWQSLEYDPVRRVSEQSALQANRSWLLLSTNPSTGNGGTCYGDSGGPHFLGTGSETEDPGIVVSVTSWGEKWCRATDWNARVDTKSVLDFINGYMNKQ